MIELSVALLVTVLVGIALGYYFKRMIMLIATGLVAVLSLYAILLMDHRDFGGMIATLFVIIGFALVVPMWVAYFLRHRGNVAACSKCLREQALDVEKKPE